MKIFVGFGYNDRDEWIEEQVFPILIGMGFNVVDGKDMHGSTLQSGVKTRIQQSDAVVGFFTIREDQGDADFTSHIWVRDEVVHAEALKKPIIPIREEGVHLPAGLLGDIQYISLDQKNRLACVVELVKALGRRNIRRLKLDPDDDELRRKIMIWQRSADFNIRYQTQDEAGIESDYKDGRLEVVDQGFYLNVSDVPKRAYVNVEGCLNQQIQFGSGWVSADAVQVKVF
ncbi:MAG: hypothetical protein PVH87_18210 [Desulfobacteraceae bacterium]|jgi:hypothetical protein